MPARKARHSSRSGEGHQRDDQYVLDKPWPASFLCAGELSETANQICHHRSVKSEGRSGTGHDTYGHVGGQTRRLKLCGWKNLQSD